MLKVIAFDLDGTLTQHKTPLCDANRNALEALAKKYRLLMVGAGQAMRIFNQLRPPVREIQPSHKAIGHRARPDTSLRP